MSKVLDTAPTFIKVGGRAKSETRLQIEALEPGQWLVTDEPATPQAIANARTKAYGVKIDPDFLGRKFSVRQSAEGFVVIGRTV